MRSALIRKSLQRVSACLAFAFVAECAMATSTSDAGQTVTTIEGRVLRLPRFRKATTFKFDGPVFTARRQRTEVDAADLTIGMAEKIQGIALDSINGDSVIFDGETVKQGGRVSNERVVMKTSAKGEVVRSSERVSFTVKAIHSNGITLQTPEASDVFLPFTRGQQGPQVSDLIVATGVVVDVSGVVVTNLAVKRDKEGRLVEPLYAYTPFGRFSLGFLGEDAHSGLTVLKIVSPTDRVRFASVSLTADASEPGIALHAAFYARPERSNRPSLMTTAARPHVRTDDGFLLRGTCASGVVFLDQRGSLRGISMPGAALGSVRVINPALVGSLSAWLPPAGAPQGNVRLADTLVAIARPLQSVAEN